MQIPFERVTLRLETPRPSDIVDTEVAVRLVVQNGSTTCRRGGGSGTGPSRFPLASPPQPDPLGGRRRHGRNGPETASDRRAVARLPAWVIRPWPNVGQHLAAQGTGPTP